MPKKRKSKSTYRHSGKQSASRILKSKSRKDSGQARMTRTRFLALVRNDMRIISLRTRLLFITGILLILIPSFFYVNETIQLAFFTPQVPIIVKQFPAPTWISIPSVDMQLPVVEEAITNGVWGIATNGISHLNTSARPQEMGPIILYGHNTNERFGPIRWLSIGATITLTAGGKQYVYKVTQTLDVAPDKVSILLSQKGETLILYTCDGFADLERFVVIAKPVR